MTQMRNSFVEKDANSSNNWLSKIQPVDNLMRMGDGTVMEAEAFSESIPMLSYTPEELGINMNATPEATAIAATNPYPYTDRQEVMVDNSPSPALNVVKEDFIDGGVQFAAEGDTVIGAVVGEVKDFAKQNPLLMFGLGAVCFYAIQKLRSNP
jgi:hypothetical protein